MPKVASTWILVLFLSAAAAVAETAAPGLEQRVDRHLQPYVDAGHLSGTVLIARGDEVLYEKSFGLADREHAVANTPRTRFCVGSINKPMTIVILARLLEAEKLALTDELAKFLPEFPRADEITVGDLLRHSAGIPHRVTSPLDETRPQTPASMVALAAAEPLVFEPGAESVYSSAGFSVLARVLELAGGKPYAELLAEHVLRPAGMADTSDAGTRATTSTPTDCSTRRRRTCRTWWARGRSTRRRATCWPCSGRSWRASSVTRPGSSWWGRAAS